MRPIDADALIKKYGDWYVEEGTESGFIGTLKNLLATEPTIQPQSTDLIDRQQAIDALDCISGVEEVLRSLPTIQPVVTDTNVGDKISKFIDGLEEIFADIRERHVDDSVCGLCEYDGAYMGQSGDWCNECPGFDKDDCFKLSDKTRKKWTEEIIKALPTVQPEPTDEQVLDYCKKRDLHLVTYDLFQSIRLNHKVSFGDKDHVWIDGKQYISLPRFQEAVKEAGPKEGYWQKDETDDCPPVFQQFRICSECGHIKLSETNFCPDCGAHMRGKHNV